MPHCDRSRVDDVAETLGSHRLRVAIFAFALALFVVTLVVLATMPICKE